MRVPAAVIAALALGALSTGIPVIWAASIWALVMVLGLWALVRASILYADVEIAPADVLVAAGAGEWLRILVRGRGRLAGTNVTLTSEGDMLGIEPVRAVTGARAATAVRTIVVGLRRGVWTLDGLVGTASDPLGLITLRRRMGPPLRVTVYPHPVTPLGWRRPRLASASGSATQTASSSAAGGTAADGVRRWTAGDPVGHIAWGPSARHGELLARQFDNEADDRLWIVVDADGGAGASLEALLAATAGIAEDELAAGRLVGLVLGGAAGAELAPGRGEAHRRALLTALAGATAAVQAARTPVATALTALHARVAGDGVVLLTACDSSTWPGALAAAAGHPHRTTAVLAGAAAVSEALRKQLNRLGIKSFVVGATGGTALTTKAATPRVPKPQTHAHHQAHPRPSALAVSGLVVTGLAAVRLSALLFGADATWPAVGAWLAGVPVGILGVWLLRRLAALGRARRALVGLLGAAAVIGVLRLGADPSTIHAPVLALVAIALAAVSAGLTAERLGARTGCVAAATAVMALGAAITSGDPAGLLGAWSGLLALHANSRGLPAAAADAATPSAGPWRGATHARRALVLTGLAFVAAMTASASGFGAPLGHHFLIEPGRAEAHDQAATGAAPLAGSATDPSGGFIKNSTAAPGATPGDEGPGFDASARAGTLDPAPGRGAAAPSAVGRSLPAGSSGMSGTSGASGTQLPLLTGAASAVWIALAASVVHRRRRRLTPESAWTCVEQAARLRGYHHIASRTTGESVAALKRLAPGAAAAIDELARIREVTRYGAGVNPEAQCSQHELQTLVAQARHGVLTGR